jgi:hypothetical protein
MKAYSLQIVLSVQKDRTYRQSQIHLFVLGTYIHLWNVRISAIQSKTTVGAGMRTTGMTTTTKNNLMQCVSPFAM